MQLNNKNNSSIYAILDLNGHFVDFSENYFQITEQKTQIGQNHFDIFTKEPENKDIFLETIETGIPHLFHSAVFEVDNKSNKIGDKGTWCFIPMFDENGSVNRILLSYIHTKEHEIKQILKTNIDPLTTLLNRKGFEDGIAEFEKSLEPGTILFMDLDGFKSVNDTHGHDVGDELLKAVSERLKAHVKHKDILARLGGDEFIIVLKNINEKNGEKVAKRIEKIISTPFIINNTEIKIGISVGVAEYPQGHKKLSEIIKSSDEKMYKSKRNKKRLIG